MEAATFASIFACLYAGHHLADFWIQTDWESRNKSLKSWFGRAVCALHCVTYGLTGAFLVWAVSQVLTDLHVTFAGLTAATALNVVLHYLADRRWLIRWLASRKGSVDFVNSSQGPMLLDQAWHYVSLVPVALVMMAL